MSIARLRINGEDHSVEVETGTTLLDALRGGVGLTGTKKGCEVGACGACTVLVDGRRIYACLALAVTAEGAEITTIEGVARGGELHPLQREFAARDALQCGYCTPGQIMSALGYLREGHANPADPAVVREWMSGNLCRCGAHPNIVAAIAAVAGAPVMAAATPVICDRPGSIAEAIGSSPPGAGPVDGARAYIAGGTDLVPLMRAGIARPLHLVDLGRCGLPAAIEVDAGEDLVIGAGARMAEVADHPVVRERCPVVAQALLASASAQVRNAATIGGNLVQRTRCPYFRDPVFECNKRRPGSGCAALSGRAPDRRHAIVGGSPACVAVHASDLAVALAALDASLLLRGPLGERRLPLAAFYLEPGETPWRETALAERELILSVRVPGGAAAGSSSAYVKVRDRASFDFALVAAAAQLRVEAGRIAAISVALGGVAPRPWRLPEVESRLLGQPLAREAVASAVRAALPDARPLRENAFKVELARRAAARAIALAAGLEGGADGAIRGGFQ